MTTEISIQKLVNLSEGLEGVDIAMRSKELGNLLKASCRPIAAAAKRYLPEPGYPGDKAGKKALRDTIQVKLKQYPEAWVVIVEPKRPPAFHRKLVEFGHRIVTRGGEVRGRTRPRPYMEPAIVGYAKNVQADFERRSEKLVQKKWQTLQ